MSENTKNNTEPEFKENAQDIGIDSGVQAETKNKKKEFSIKLRLIAFFAALAIVLGAIFAVVALSSPPKYEEIEGRLAELLDASYEINVVLFGEGLPTYERVSDPLNSLKYYNTGEYYAVGEKELERRVAYYYTIEQREGETVVAYKNSNAYTESFSYAYVSQKQMSAEELAAQFPAVGGAELKEGQDFYGEVWRSADGKDICYLVPYKETEYEMYYTVNDPENYDYVRDDSPYRSIANIKEKAATVYSEKYLNSLSATLFDGVTSGDTVLLARYSEWNVGGVSRLAQLNTYEPFFTERRAYDLSSAKVIRWGSNRNRVIIEINSWLPSSPDEVRSERLYLERQDGDWYLASPTF